MQQRLATAAEAFAPGVAASLREGSLDKELYTHWMLSAQRAFGWCEMCDVNGHSSSPGGCERIC